MFRRPGSFVSAARREVHGRARKIPALFIWQWQVKLLGGFEKRACRSIAALIWISF